MQRLFYGISPLDRKHFNYYFALKKQMAYLDHFTAPTDKSADDFSPLKNLGRVQRPRAERSMHKKRPG